MDDAKSAVAMLLFPSLGMLTLLIPLTGFLFLFMIGAPFAFNPATEYEREDLSGGVMTPCKAVFELNFHILHA